MQSASMINCSAVLHLQIIYLVGNTAGLMQMPQHLTAFKSGNSVRVINQWYHLKRALLNKCASPHGIGTSDGEGMI